MKIFLTRATQTLVLILLSTTISNAQIPSNNECSGAIDLSSFLGQALEEVQFTSLYDNTEATSENSDPLTGWDCFGEPQFDPNVPLVENTLWFTFQGDGNAYFFETGECSATNYITDGDTQIALYEGDCNNLTPIECNDDGPSTNGIVFPAGVTIATTPGTTYYMMVDGFNFQGSLATGEFCFEITRKPLVGCGEMSPGTITDFDENICFGDPTNFAISEVLFPNNEPEIVGLVWLVSSAPITNTASPSDDPNFIGSLPILNLVYAPVIANNGSPLPTATTHFFTPVMIAGAVDTSGNFTFSGLDFSQGCLTLGQAYEVNFLDSAFTISSDITDAIDSQGGSIALDISGGSGDYDVSWDTGQSTSTISDLGPGDYIATISDPTGCIPDSTITFTVDNSVATIDLDFDQKIDITPNPVKVDQTILLDFDLPAQRDLQIQVFNTTGQLMKQNVLEDFKRGEVIMNLDHLSRGLYFVHILTNQNEFTTKKLVIE